MSELTQCNYCSLQEIRRDARRAGKKVVLRPGWNGGTDVLVIPDSINIPQGRLPHNGAIRKKYIYSWVQEIGDRCSC